MINDGFILGIGGLHALQVALQRPALMHTVGAAHGAEFRAINGDPFSAHQSYRTRKANQLRSGFHHRIAMQTSEFSNALMIGTQPSQQPHQFDIALALRFQPAGRTNLLQIAIQIEFQQIPRIISRPSRLGSLSSHKA